MTTPEQKALLIGCGIAGPVTAMFLQRAGLRPVIYEAQPGTMDQAGGFLGLAVNGMNVLRTLGSSAPVEAAGFPFTGMAFSNGRGRRLGSMDLQAEEQGLGGNSIVIKRGRLHQVLREEAVRRGIPVEYGKRLSTIETVGREVIAHFEDGSSARGDVLLGCDGIHSRTRQLILPDIPGPVYTGLVGCGGFARVAVPPTAGVMQMSFGDRAFFGHTVAPDGEVYWFNNMSFPEEQIGNELFQLPEREWRKQVLALHAGDPAPIPDIIRATEGAIGRYPTYDIPSLPVWHRGLVCLVGDAAHATSPHAGQGASMALEDAIVLAKCLGETSWPEAAFERYQALRKHRVERLVRSARRTGNQKAMSSPLTRWVRDRMLPLFIKRAATANRWVYRYRVEWN
jgi:2-polyprenyl-6-methoxyphenol hydroxylase-like FAD-dependent oxidoreductase